MGYADREYARRPVGGRGFNGRPPGGSLLGHPGTWSITTWIIALNVAVFVLDSLLIRNYGVDVAPGWRMGPLEFWGFFSVSAGIYSGQVWRFLSFQFLHASVGHLFFNMLAIYFFGPMIERYLGSPRYLAYYLLAGIAGPLMYMALWSGDILITHPQVPMVGASAGVFGILIGAAVIAPNTTVMLIFPPIPIQLRTLAWILVGMGALTVLRNGMNAGGEAAHLGGALAGYLLINRPRLLNTFDWAWWKARRKTTDNAGTGAGGPGGGGPGAWQQRIERDRRAQFEVDRILDKVHRQGLASLTDREKQILREETESQRRSP